MSTPFSEHQMTLGELIDALAKVKPEAPVRFDFCGFQPDGVDSYRGYYDHLALGHSEKGDRKAGELLAELRRAVGATFTGYKGGEFRMDARTPMWVSNWGECNDTAVSGVVDEDYWVVIQTAHAR